MSLIQKYGKSYYLASLFFPAKIKQAVFVLYDFVRIPDNVVDDPSLSLEQKKAQLISMQAERQKAYNDQDITNSKRWRFVSLFLSYTIPIDYSQAFYEAMLMDTQVFRYVSYTQLQSYMYGSAEVVGLMMCCILWHESEALPFARKLGEAMQVSNFLRDVYEDCVDLGRIYMPLERLQEYGLSHEDVVSFCTSKTFDDRWVGFMKNMIWHNRSLYHESYQGIQHLHNGQKAVYLAGKLYESILDNIKKNNYDVFRLSARTSTWQKYKVVLANMR